MEVRVQYVLFFLSSFMQNFMNIRLLLKIVKFGRLGKLSRAKHSILRLKAMAFMSVFQEGIASIFFWHVFFSVLVLNISTLCETKGRLMVQTAVLCKKRFQVSRKTLDVASNRLGRVCECEWSFNLGLLGVWWYFECVYIGDPAESVLTRRQQGKYYSLYF